MLDIDTIDASGLALMCEQKWQESDVLDFKRTLPGRNDQGRRELLKDACAFANAAGGVLIYGVIDENGAAASLQPITNESSDEAILRLGQILDSSIEPRLRALRFKPVEVPGGYVLLLRVPASFDGPHRYLVNDASRFVMRSGRHTVDLTYQQLRAAFGNTLTLLDRARGFRGKRLAAIQQSGVPLSFKAGPIVVVHVIPIEAMAVGRSVDVTQFYYNYADLTFNEWMNAARHLNLDGIAVHISGEQHTATYTQLFRTGVTEAARWAGLMSQELPWISSQVVAKFIREAIPKLAAISTKAGLAGPGIVGVALVRVRGWSLALNNDDVASPPDRADLVFPEVWVDDITDIGHVDAIARPVLDLLWQAYGEPQCRHYKDGIWSVRV